MSYVKLWVHVVFSTKEREPLLTKEVRYPLFEHIRQNALTKDIHLDFINGYLEHVYCLISLGKDQTVSKVLQLIKGESSYWLNNQRLLNTKFSWQDDYFAVSVGESQVPVIRTYIKNQEQHHRNKSFEEEVNEFLESYGWSRHG